MIKLKNPRFLIFIVTGLVLIAITFIYFVNFNIPEGEVPGPRKIDRPEGITPNEITPPTSPPPGSSVPAEPEGSAEVEKVIVRGNEFSFSPVSIAVSRGAKVELTFENIGKAPHNYAVDELGIQTKTIGGGKTEIVTFTAPNTAGIITYSSYCSVPGHREAGMEGTIVIE